LFASIVGWMGFMKTSAFRGRSAIAMVVAIAGVLLSAAGREPRIAPLKTHAARPSAHATLVAFPSNEALAKFLRRVTPKPKAFPAMAMAAPPMASMGAVESATPTEARGAPGITNTQEAGVDEGDIVKLKGNILVILRRGRLFTVSLAHRGMRPVDSIDAFPPGVDARDDWYDEMLISGDRIVVIGYSYARGGTEINRFRLGDDGRLGFVDAYQLRSNDYYSSRNYASRLIGHDLIFYSPLYLRPRGEDPLDALPALRRWNGDTSDKGFHRIAGAQQVFIPPALLNAPDVNIEALHTVTSCDLAAPTLDCTATSVLGPNSRSFYVSPNAVYVWVSDAWPADEFGRRAKSLLYRLPVDGSRPSAVGVRGAPTDQFSFSEDARNGVLNVLVRSDSAGDAMWRPEFAQGSVALVRIPLDAIGDGSREVDASRYRTLPRPKGDAYSFHNRFVGDYVLYGAGNSWGTPRDRDGALTVVPLAGGEPTELVIGHGIDRIEAMGRAAVVIGSNEKDTVFTAIELASGRPRMGDRYVQAESAQAETRSHAFFFFPDWWAGDGSTGFLGLPVARPARAAYRQLFDSSASMIFLRREHAHFIGMGELDAANEGIADDDCRASCVDWYGNARPIFLADRTFALLGYELIEGRRTNTAIRETGRISFAPKRSSARPAG
jgi:hypothetical protein